MSNPEQRDAIKVIVDCYRNNEDLTKEMICEHCKWFNPHICGSHGECEQMGIVENEARGCELWTLKTQ